MAKLKKLKPVFDWAEVVADEKDWAASPPAALRNLLFQMYLVRRFERNLLELKKNNLIHGPVHTSIGQEAVAVGTMAALGRADGIGGTHRAHHQYLAKACSYHLAPAFDPVADEFPAALKQAMATLLAEIMGLDAGCCRGRGGSMHLCDPKIGVLGTNAIVGGGIPLAAGAAFAEKYRKSGNVVVSFFGDGATNQGAFHEALNLAGLWKLPVIYVLENNRYAVATSLAESSAAEELSVRAAGYGMTGRIVDGNDVLAVKAAIAEAAQSLRGGDAPPVFIDMKTYRDFHHAGDIPGSAFGYRSREEEQEWKERDPVETFRRDLLARGFLTETQDSQLQQLVDGLVAEATGTCVDAGAIKPALLPAPASIAEGLRGSGAEFATVRFTEPEAVPGPRKKMKYVEAIAAATGRWLEQDPSVFVLGEEVGHMTGGPYLATKGLAKRFPGRVLDTPISEAGFCGLAGGAAMNGLLPGQAGEVLKGTLLRGHVKTRWIVSSLLQYNFLFIATTLPVLVVCSLVVLASGCLPMSVSLLLFAGVLVSAVLPTVLFIWIRRGMVGDILAVIKKLPLVGRMVKDSLIEEGRKIDHEIRSVWKHRPQDFILASALLTAARFLAITEVWLILFLMNKAVPVPIAGAIFAASQVFSYVLMFLPTSFGVLEGGAKGIFKWFALDGDVGLSMELVRRIRKFFFMFVGLACLGVLAIVDPGVKKIIKTPEGGETSEEDMGDE